jgi:hypothetical protein
MSERVRYPSSLTDRDTSTRDSTKWSYVRYGHMEQRLFIQISRRDGVDCKKLHIKLLELYGDDALSYPEVCYWSQPFLMGRECVKHARRTGRPPDFNVHLRIQSAFGEIPLLLFDAFPRPHTHSYHNPV